MSVEIPEQDNSAELAAMSDEDFLNSVNSAETVAPAPDTETSVSAEVSTTTTETAPVVVTSTEAATPADVNF